jgi:type VI protein secretion system component VasF
MSTLLLSLPGGAEWIIIIGIMVVPVMLMYVVLKYSLKSAIKEAIKELKKEGQI